MFKRIVLLIAWGALAQVAVAQVGIGTTTPNNHAILELVSNNKGLLMPRLTTAQRDAMSIGVSEEGLVIYNASLGKMQFWNGAAWSDIGVGSIGIENQFATAQVADYWISGYGRVGGNLAVDGIMINNYGLLEMGGSTSNRIMYNANGIGAPTLSTRSLGTKIVFYDALSAVNADVAIGINAGEFWFTVPNNSNQYRFYAGVNPLFTLKGNGSVELDNAVINRKIVLYNFGNNDHEFSGLGINSGVMRYQVPATSNSHVFYAAQDGTSSNELMRIQGDGKIGIGTATPTAPLEVVQTAYGSGTVRFTRNMLTLSNPILELETQNTGDGGVPLRIKHSGYGDFMNITDEPLGTSVFRIRSSGYVGIGTALPSAMLSVGSDGFQVDGSGNILSVNGITTNFPNTQGGAGTFLKNDGAGNLSWAAAGGSGWGLTGNAGTTASNFIGTTDDVSLNFKINGQQAGFVASSSTHNGVFLGYRAGKSQTSGFNNTAIGHQAMENTISGVNNSALGFNVMYSNQSGSNNVALGTVALSANTIGNGNTALGAYAMRSNIDGESNTATGFYAMYANNSGTNNTAYGAQALQNSVIGINNTAVGNMALYKNTADYNTAVGNQAMFNNTTGSMSVALGNAALFSNTTGIKNTVVGSGALYANTSGVQNVVVGESSLAIGNHNRMTVLGTQIDITTDRENVIAIGYGIVDTDIAVNNMVRIGNSSITKSDIAGTLTYNAQSATNSNTFPANRGTAGQFLKTDGAGNLSWAALMGDNLGNHLMTNNLITDNHWISGDNDPEGLFVNFSGKVGAGISTPNAVLHVNDLANSQGDLRLTAGFVTGTSGTDGLVISINSSAANILSYENLPLNFGTNGSNRMVITGTGNVGIGTGSPANLFSVGSTSGFQINTDGNIDKIKGVTYDWPTANGIGALLSNASGALAWTPVVQSATNGLSVSAGSAAVLGGTLTQSTTVTQANFDMNFIGGKIGIGTVTPASLLHIVVPSTPVVSTNVVAQRIDNNAANVSTDGIVKTGLDILSGGSFQGGAGTVTRNYGLSVNVAGADENYAATFMGGNVGIGTATPSNSLVIEKQAGYAEIDAYTYGTASYYSAMVFGHARGTQATPSTSVANDILGAMVFRGYGPSGWQANAAQIRADAAESFTATAAGSRLVFSTVSNGTTSSLPRMTIDHNGNVGLSTTSPSVPLDVNMSTTALGTLTARYLNSTTTGTTTLTGASSVTAAISVRAIGGFLSTGTGLNGGFYVTSDRRIKDVVGLSNTTQDLTTLRRIRITDYRFKDSLSAGNVAVKGVIAQELEAVYPQAVSKQTNYIPNVYALSKAVRYDAATSSLTVTLAKTPDLAAGDKVKLITDQDGEKMATVAEVNGHSFVVKDWEKTVNQVFVYGKEVHDFRIVDYDRLSVLNVSALQELAKIKDQQAAQIQELEIRLQESQQTIQSLRNDFEVRLRNVEAKLQPKVAEK